MTLQPPRDPSPLRVSHGYMVILAAVGMFTACRNDNPTTGENSGHDLVNVMGETCTVCNIDLDSVQTLTGPYVGMRTASLQSSSVSGSARIVIAPGAELYTLTLLEPGSPNAPTLRGREGEGPGEFRRSSPLRSRAGIRQPAPPRWCRSTPHGFEPGRRPIVTRSAPPPATPLRSRWCRMFTSTPGGGSG